MYNQYHKEYSHHLGYDMEFEVWACRHAAVFRPRPFLRMENRGMIDTASVYRQRPDPRVLRRPMMQVPWTMYTDPLHAWRSMLS